MKNQQIENNKRIAKNTFLLYIRMLFILFVSLYTSRIVLKTLGIENYGIYNVVGGIVTIFSFLNGSMSTATQRYLTYEIGTGNQKKLKKVFSTSITIHGLIALVIVLLSETIGLWFLTTQMNIPANRMGAAMWVYQLSILTCIVIMMSVPYNAVIIAHERMGVFAYISIFEVSAKLLIVYLLLFLNSDKLITYAILMFIIQLIIRLIYSIYCKKNFTETRYKFVIDKPLLKEMLGFAGWNMFGILAGIGITQGINITLNIFFGPIVNAARGISVQIQNAITGFCSNFQLALSPQITKSYACGEMKQMNTLIYASAKYSFFLLFFLSLPILIETDIILKWWLNDVPKHTANFIRIMISISMVNVMADSLLVASQATGKIRLYQILVGGILLLIVPIAYIALKLGYPPESVFLIHLICAVIAQFVRLYIVHKLTQLPILEYTKEVILKIIFVTAISLIIPITFHFFMDASFIRFLTVSILCVCSVTVSIYNLGLNKSEKGFIYKKIKERLHHGKSN